MVAGTNDVGQLGQDGGRIQDYTGSTILGVADVEVAFDGLSILQLSVIRRTGEDTRVPFQGGVDVSRIFGVPPRSFSP